ncbi:MAG: NADH-quinone oxidoreductase subunit N [Pseudohongiella nitratireducens]|nr:NADH-quinone oxidoreductase subunit N [Pseudohongiella nitratireducens]MDF1624344.1 NADH-quinone oxidoreductase subunit N [Pseudohongiella nitratireducens]
MSIDVLINLSQIIMLGLSTLVVMLVIAFRRDHKLTYGLTMAGLLLSLLIFLFISPADARQATELLVMDDYSLFFSTLVIISALAVTALSYPYFEGQQSRNEEFYLLLLMATLGGVVLACSQHFVSFFLGMEILSICLYGMIAYTVQQPGAAKFPLEAGIKYLLLSGASSAMILFGIALIYTQTGTLLFSEIPQRLVEAGQGNPIVITGWMMAIAGIAFKLSLVPFHMWTPDVYEGAPVPATTFIATASKAAMVAVVLRLVLASQAYEIDGLLSTVTVLAALSMVAGNLLALLQKNIKRLLAYSSIAHLGYVMIVIVAAGSMASSAAAEAVTYYMAAYVFTTLAGFAVVSALSNSANEQDQLASYQGLFWQRPWVALPLMIVMLSLAGIPLTMGFIGKFYVIQAGVTGQLWLLLAMLVIGSGIGIFYYLRVVYLLVQPPGAEGEQGSLPLAVTATLFVTSAAIVLLGTWPSGLIASISGLL